MRRLAGVERRRLGLVVADAADPGRQVDDLVRRGRGHRGVGLRGIGEVELGLAGGDDVGPGSSQTRATTTRPRKPEPPVTRTRRPDQKSLMAAMLRAADVRQHGRVRVAYTLEQCWHDVPGGTAVAALGMARALVRTARRGAGRRRGAAPPPAAGAASSRRSPCGRSPLPRRVLYEAWRRLGWPPVERATGPVDVVHATTIIVPPRGSVAAGRDRARPRLPATSPTSFTAPRRAGVHAAGLDRIAATRPTWCCARRGPRWTTPWRAGPGLAERLRLVPLGPGPGRPAGAAAGGGRAAPPRPRPRRYLLFVGTLEPRKNLRPPAARPSARSTCRPASWSWSGPDGWGERAAPAGSGSATLARVRGRGHEGRALRRRRRRVLPEPARGVRPAGARGHGPRRAGRDQPGDGHGRGGRRRGGAGRPARSRGHRPRASARPSTGATSSRRPARCARPRSRGPATAEAVVAAYREVLRT